LSTETEAAKVVPKIELLLGKIELISKNRMGFLGQCVTDNFIKTVSSSHTGTRMPTLRMRNGSLTDLTWLLWHFVNANVCACLICNG